MLLFRVEDLQIRSPTQRDHSYIIKAAAREHQGFLVSDYRDQWTKSWRSTHQSGSLFGYVQRVLLQMLRRPQTGRLWDEQSRNARESNRLHAMEQMSIRLPPRWVNGSALEQTLRVGPSPFASSASQVHFHVPSRCNLMTEAALRLLSLLNQLSGFENDSFVLAEGGTMARD